MKKFYRKFPSVLEDKINHFTTDLFEVAVVLKLYKSEIGLTKYRKIGISVDSNGNYHFDSSVPEPTLGKYSKKNVEGWTEVHKDEPKILKSFSLGDRPIYGDWSNGTFELVVGREVYRRTEHDPKNWTISTSLIEKEHDSSGEYVLVKVKVDEVFNRNNWKDNHDILDAINLMFESMKKVDVFEESATKIDYITSISVDWEIFPPGNRDLDIVRIIGNRKLTDQQVSEFQNRYDFIRSLNPLRFVNGLGGSSSYFGAIFRDDLVVFENIKYGNAIYVLHEDWKQISKLSRTEILSSNYNFNRIIHDPYWQQNLLNAIKFNSAA